MHTAASLLHEVPKSVTIRFVFGPIFELQVCYKAVVTQKRMQYRYIMHAAIIILSIIIGGIALPEASSAFLNFLQALPLVNIAGPGQGFLVFLAGAWIVSYPASWISRGIINLYSLWRYGDIQYFLSKTRMQELEAKSSEPAEYIGQIFRHVRSRLRNKKFAPGARLEDLTEVLEAFMNGEAEDAVLVYRKQKSLYKTYLWEQGDTEDILKPERIISIAKKFAANPEEITGVLEHCILGLKSDSTIIGARKDDYIKIILNILEMNELGLKLFFEQQQIILQQRILREKEYQANLYLLNQLKALQNKRQTPSRREHSNPDDPENPIINQIRQLPTEAPLSTEEKLALTADQEELAKILLRQNASKIGILPPAAEVEQEKISNPSLAILIQYLHRNALSTRNELNAMPPQRQISATALRV